MWKGLGGGVCCGRIEGIEPRGMEIWGRKEARNVCKLKSINQTVCKQDPSPVSYRGSIKILSVPWILAEVLVSGFCGRGRNPLCPFPVQNKLINKVKSKVYGKFKCCFKTCNKGGNGPSHWILELVRLTHLVKESGGKPPPGAIEKVLQLGAPSSQEGKRSGWPCVPRSLLKSVSQINYSIPQSRVKGERRVGFPVAELPSEEEDIIVPADMSRSACLLPLMGRPPGPCVAGWGLPVLDVSSPRRAATFSTHHTCLSKTSYCSLNIFLGPLTGNVRFALRSLQNGSSTQILNLLQGFSI